MRTLILFGSPRAEGDTAALVRALRRELPGEAVTVDCYREDIGACMDCRACREIEGCVIQDGMQRVFELIEASDNVVIASPVHFETLSSGLLRVASRLQTYCSAAIFRHEKPAVRARRGAVLLSQGGSGGAENAYRTAKQVFRSIGITEIAPPAVSSATDRLPAGEDKDALEQVKRAAEFLLGQDPPALES